MTFSHRLYLLAISYSYACKGSGFNRKQKVWDWGTSRLTEPFQKSSLVVIGRLCEYVVAAFVKKTLFTKIFRRVLVLLQEGS